MLEHFPDGRITPVVCNLLWEDLDLEVIVAAFQHSRTCMDVFNINTMHVLSSILESILKCLLVLLGFAFAVGDETLTISYEDEDTSFVHSIERGDIGYGV